MNKQDYELMYIGAAAIGTLRGLLQNYTFSLGTKTVIEELLRRYDAAKIDAESSPPNEYVNTLP